MANDLATARPKANTASAPNLPASLRRLLADPFSLGSELVQWTPPAVPPETLTLRAARQELERTTQPGSHGHIAWCLGKMAKGMAHRKADATDWAMRTEAWADACGHFPDDLWSAATLELLQTKTYFPAPAEMVELVGPKLAERRRMLERVNLMLDGRAKIEAPKPFVREPEDVRLRTVKSGWLRIGNFDRANKAEARLAEIENRRSEFIEPPARKGPVYAPAEPSVTASPDMQARLNMAIAVEWRKRGNNTYADRLELEAHSLAPHLFAPPVEHRDVPEGVAHG